MGDMAELMLDGTCCSVCGEFIDSDTGYPTICAACARKDGEVAVKSGARCPSCGKKFRSDAGRDQHMRDTGHQDRGRTMSDGREDSGQFGVGA